MSAEYESPLCKRYSGKEMLSVFTDGNKFSVWRKLWVALAESQKELGLSITQTQIDEMKSHIYDIDFEKVSEYEHKTRHEVMAHILAFGEQCHEAKPIIHLGATSCYVGDNADIIIQKPLNWLKIALNTVIPAKIKTYISTVFQPSFFSLIRNKQYTKQTFRSDLSSGLIVGVIAIPLGIAFSTAAGLSPDKGLITCIIAS